MRLIGRTLMLMRQCHTSLTASVTSRLNGSRLSSFTGTPTRQTSSVSSRVLNDNGTNFKRCFSSSPRILAPTFSVLSNLMESQLRISSNLHPNPVSTIFKRNANVTTLKKMHRRGPVKKFRPPRKPLDGRPMMKGVVLKTLIKKPRKPNSANRKCVLVRLANGKEKVAYVPGIGHNLQEHNVVLVRCGRLQDVPGVKLKCIRGVFDLPHVIKQAAK